LLSLTNNLYLCLKSRAYPYQYQENWYQ
jgi:hypothetical protein